MKLSSPESILKLKWRAILLSEIWQNPVNKWRSMHEWVNRSSKDDNDIGVYDF